MAPRARKKDKTTSEAPQQAPPRQPPPLRVTWKWVLLAPALAVLTVFILTVVDPFEFESATKRQSANIFYKAYATLYPTSNRDNISVVLLDDATVNQRESWPPSHLLHGDVLAAILDYEPLAVLVDLYFIHPREGDVFARTQSVIEDYAGANPPVPLFMIAANQTAAPPARREIMELAADKKVRLVAAEIESELGEPPLYPLRNATRYPPAAVAIHETLCRELPENRRPAGIRCDNLHANHAEEFEVVWGLKPSPLNCLRAATGPYRYVCRELFTSLPMRLFQLTIEGLLPRIWRPTDPMPLRYHAAISTEDLLDGGKRDELEPYLKGKIVVYGAHLNLVKDQVFSPVHGTTDGAFIHAMALDNLFTFGSRVVHRGAGHRTFRKEWTEFQPAVLMVLAALVIALNRWRLLRAVGPSFSIEDVKEADDHFLRWTWWGLVITIAIAGLLEFAYWGISPFNWLALIIVVHVAHLIEKRFFRPDKWMAQSAAGHGPRGGTPPAPAAP